MAQAGFPGYVRADEENKPTPAPSQQRASSIPFEQQTRFQRAAPAVSAALNPQATLTRVAQRGVEAGAGAVGRGVQSFWKWGNTVPGAARDTARAAVGQVTGSADRLAAQKGETGRWSPAPTTGNVEDRLAAMEDMRRRNAQFAPKEIPELYTNRPEVAASKGGYYLSRQGGEFEAVVPGQGMDYIEQRFGREGYQYQPPAEGGYAANVAASTLPSIASGQPTGTQNIGVDERGRNYYKGPQGEFLGFVSAQGRQGRESIPDIPGLGATENALIKAGMDYRKVGGFRMPNGQWVPEKIIPGGSAASMVNARANERQNEVALANAIRSAGVQERGDILRYQADIAGVQQRGSEAQARLAQEREEGRLSRELTREGYGYDILGKRITSEGATERAAKSREGRGGMTEAQFASSVAKLAQSDPRFMNPDGSYNYEAAATEVENMRTRSGGGEQRRTRINPQTGEVEEFVPRKR